MKKKSFAKQSATELPECLTKEKPAKSKREAKLRQS